MARTHTILLSLLTAASYAIAAPSACLSQTTIEDVAGCLETYTVPELTDTTAQCSNIGNPVDNQGTEWVAAVTTLMGTSTPSDCTSHVLGSSLTSDFAFALFTDSASKSFCLLYETATSASQPTKFKHGWGFVIVPANSEDVSHPLHFSAPHPKFDQNTVKQAAALFKLTGGKSMVASGRHRHACAKVTDCSGSGNVSAPNYETDPAHDDSEPIFSAMVAIRDWQNNHGGCLTATCGHLQFHGNAQCAYDAFLSHGRASSSCYTPSTLPVRRLKAALDAQRPGGTHGYPGTEPTCNLTATRNIFGRLLNGIARSDICITDDPPVPPCSALGQFVHIEQDAASRDSSQYTAWAAAIIATYTP